jgi:hypothetical protein
MATTARARILPPYTRRTNDWRHHLVRLTALGSVLLFALFYGLAIAVLPQQFMTMLLLPLGLLVLLVLWLAPDLDPKWDGTVRFLTFAYIAASIVWPYYLAIDITGLPWMSIARILQTAMLVTAVIFFAMSGRARRQLSEVLKAEPLMTRMWFAVFALVFFTMPLNGTAGFTFGSKFLVYHLGVFLIAAWVFRSERAPITLQRVFVACVPFLGLFGLIELWNGRPIWIDYMPPLFRIADTALLETFSRTSIRTLGGEVRVRSAFGTPLFYGEYLGMMMPFVLHATLTAPNKLRQTLGASLAVFLVASVFVCSSRSGFVALLAGTFAYYVIFIIWRYNQLRKKADYVTSLAFWATPVTFMVTVFAVLTVPGLRYRVLGGGASSYSDAARDRQWDNTMAAAFSRPWGHGPGSSGQVAGDFKSNAVGMTVDSTQVVLLADYGFLGLILFPAAYLWAIWVMFGVAIRAETTSEKIALPAFGAMATFLATRHGIASDVNFYLVCIMMGMGLALSWRQQQRVGRFDPAGAYLLAFLSGLWSGRRGPAQDAEPVPLPAAPLRARRF